MSKMPSHSKHDKSSFPPIANRQNSNELDNHQDSCRQQEINDDNESTCASPLFKLPTIERTKSRSISSISTPSSTLGSRQFSRDKQSRRSICRSPSCPSHLGLSRSNSIDKETDTAIEHRIYDHFPQRDEDEDSNVKLPSIFRNASSLPMSPRHSTLSNEWKHERENGYVYSLRRTESFQENNSKENTMHEQHHTHALLLPLRNVDNVSKGKKKKKKYSKSHSTGNDDYEHALTERESSLGRWGGFENEQNQINGSKERLIEGAVTDRSVEIVSARKMKKWMKQHPQKEGQVKA